MFSLSENACSRTNPSSKCERFYIGKTMGNYLTMKDTEELLDDELKSFTLARKQLYAVQTRLLKFPIETKKCANQI